MSRPAVLHVNRCPCTNLYEEYERRKREYERMYPEATPEEYMRAMKKIADELGI